MYEDLLFQSRDAPPSRSQWPETGGGAFQQRDCQPGLAGDLSGDVGELRKISKFVG